MTTVLEAWSNPAVGNPAIYFDGYWRGYPAYSPTEVQPSAAVAALYLVHGSRNAQWETWMIDSVEHARTTYVQANGGIYNPAGSSFGIEVMEFLRPICMCRMALDAVLTTQMKAQWDTMINNAVDYLVAPSGPNGAGVQTFYTNGNINLGYAAAFLLAYQATGRAANLAAHETQWAFVNAPGGAVWGPLGAGWKEVVAPTLPDGSDGQGFFAEGASENLGNASIDTNANYWFSSGFAGNPVTRDTIVDATGSLKVDYLGGGEGRAITTEQATGSISEGPNGYDIVPYTKYKLSVRSTIPNTLTGGGAYRRVGLFEWTTGGSLVTSQVFNFANPLNVQTNTVETFQFAATQPTTRRVSLRLSANAVGTVYYKNISLPGYGLDQDYSQLQIDVLAQTYAWTREPRWLSKLNQMVNYVGTWVDSNNILSRWGGTRHADQALNFPFITTGRGVLAGMGGRSDLTATFTTQWNRNPNGIKTSWDPRLLANFTPVPGVYRDIGAQLGPITLAQRGLGSPGRFRAGAPRRKLVAA